jgi:hypothetical protein
MRALVFDPFSGASGDMIVASLLDVGADKKRVVSSMESIKGVKVELRRVVKKGISSLKLDVLCQDSHTRKFQDITEELQSIRIEEEIKEEAIKIFEKLARAEARVHGVSIDEMHFHEIGAKDAMADVIGAVVAIKSLSPERILSLPANAGAGFVEMNHGLYPVPAPATSEILRDSKLLIKGGPIEKELLTPTGAAILSHFVNSSVNFLPQMRIEAVGYGAGSLELPFPNVLRALLGELDSMLLEDDVVILETNVDDITPEVLAHFAEDLMSSGALDVSVIPATMKKGRSGHLIRVIAKPHEISRISRKMVEDLGTLGIRILPVKHRLIAIRRIEKIRIELGGKEYEVSVKIASDLEGKVLGVSPEYEDCKRVHEETGIPLKDVMKLVEEFARSKWVQRT